MSVHEQWLALSTEAISEERAAYYAAVLRVLNDEPRPFPSRRRASDVAVCSILWNPLHYTAR
jgi:hypothetical protein